MSDPVSTPLAPVAPVAAPTDAADDSSLVGLLNQLAEVPDPAPVSMVPQTAGWAVLAAVLATALMWGAYRWWRRYRANAYRRAALVALAEVGDAPVRVSEILKRVAMVSYGRRRVAVLSGLEWVRFLDKGFSGSGFEHGAGATLAQAMYAPDGGATPQGLNQLACAWVRTHSASFEANRA